MATSYRKRWRSRPASGRLQDVMDVDPLAGVGGGPMEGVEVPQKPQQGGQSGTGTGQPSGGSQNPASGKEPPQSAISNSDLAAGIDAELLAVDSIDQIAEEVAVRVLGAKKNVSHVVIADRQLVAAYQKQQALSAQVTLLEAALKMPSQPASALALAPLIATAKTIIGGLGKLGAGFGSIEPYLRTNVSRSGRTFVLGPDLLEAAVASRLADLTVSVPRLGIASSVSGDSLVERILSLALLPKPAEPADPAFAAHKSVEMLVAQLFAKSGDPAAPTLAEQLVAAEQLDVPENAAMLVLDLPLAGGSYRLRESWWRSFLGIDGLSYSGAVAASFFLVRASNGQLLDSGVLYATSGYTRFEKRKGTVPRLSPRREHRELERGGRKNGGRGPAGPALDDRPPITEAPQVDAARGDAGGPGAVRAAERGEAE